MEISSFIRAPAAILILGLGIFPAHAGETFLAPDNINQTPVSATNPLPVTATISSTTTVGVEGADGLTQASASNPLPTTNIPVLGTTTDKSGTISVGGTSQQLAAANASRRRLIIQNPCSSTTQGIATAESLFINFVSVAAATGTSFELTACGSFDMGSGPSSGEIVNVIAATTGHKYIAKEW